VKHTALAAKIFSNQDVMVLWFKVPSDFEETSHMMVKSCFQNKNYLRAQDHFQPLKELTQESMLPHCRTALETDPEQQDDFETFHRLLLIH
jgi:hypothetical protein